jgi:hypothetical protein
MDYPFQYFYEYVDKHKYNKNSETIVIFPEVYDELDLFEVVRNSREILHYIRSLEYKLSDLEDKKVHYLRLVKSLTKILVEIEQIGKEIVIDLVQFNYPKKDYVVYSNINLMYDELCTILENILYYEELLPGVADSIKLMNSFMGIPYEFIYRDYKLIIEHVQSDFELNKDVIKKYGLNHYPYWQEPHFDTLLSYYDDEVATNLEYLNRRLFENSDHTLKYYFKRYVKLYMRSQDYEKSQSYAYLLREIIKRVNPIISYDKLIENIIAILVSSNVCHDLVLEYFDLKFKELKHRCSKQFIADFVNKQIQLIDRLFDVRGFIWSTITLKYSEDDGDSLVSKLLQLLKEKQKEYELLIAFQDNDNKIDTNKVWFNSSAECFGLLIFLMIKVGLISENNSKNKIGEILSNVFKFKGKPGSEDVKSRTIKDAINDSKDIDNIEFLKSKIKSLLDELKYLK